jgi:hypothetical protein
LFQFFLDCDEFARGNLILPSACFLGYSFYLDTSEKMFCFIKQHVDPDFSKDSKFSKKGSRTQAFTNESLKLAQSSRKSQIEWKFNEHNLVPTKILMNIFPLGQWFSNFLARGTPK